MCLSCLTFKYIVLIYFLIFLLIFTDQQTPPRAEATGAAACPASTPAPFRSTPERRAGGGHLRWWRGLEWLEPEVASVAEDSSVQEESSRECTSAKNIENELLLPVSQQQNNNLEGFCGRRIKDNTCRNICIVMF